MRLAAWGLEPDTRYAVQVRAVNADSVSSWSQIWKFTTAKDNVSPSMPTGFAFAWVGPSLNASWLAVTTDADGQPIKDFSHYELQIRNIPGGAVKIIKTTNNTVGLSIDEVKQILGEPLSTHYYGKVRAVDTADNVSEWTTEILAQTVAPEPPTNAVVVEGVDSVSISWDLSPSTDVISYRVYGSTNPAFIPDGNNRLFEGDANNFTHYTSTYQMHYYKIRAYSILNLESADLLAQGTPQSPFEADTTPPAVPGVLAATISRSTVGTVTTAKAVLTWTFDAGATDNEDIQNFIVRWRKVGATNWNVQYIDKVLRTADVQLPEPYSNYEFAIASVDVLANYSAYSSTVTLTGALAGAPAAPVGVVATTGLDSLSLRWTAATEGDVTYGGFYEVEIATNSGFTTGLLQYKTGNNSLVVSGLAQGTIYYYRIRAVDSSGTVSTWTTGNSTTGTIPVVLLSDTYAPGTPSAPSVTGGIGSLFVSWNPVTLNSVSGAQNDIVTYDVHLSATSGFTPAAGTKVGEVSGTMMVIENLPGTTTPLAYGTTYYVRIVAKDRDGASAASAQASGQIAKAGTGDIGPGAITATEIASDAVTTPKILAGAVTTDKMTANTISGSVIQAGTLTANKITTGDLSSAIITIATGGQIKSANYVANTSGFSLSSAGLDIRSGTISAGTLVSGTISSTAISIGAGGSLTVDSTGEIKSNNYSAGVSGWRLWADGLELNGLDTTVSASNITTGTIGAQTITVGAGGTIRSADWNGSSLGWQLSSTGFTTYAGTIQGAAVYTNELRSINTDATTGQYRFTINSGGYASFSGARIYGNTILGSSSSTTHYIQSYNFSSGSAGWKIDAAGNSEFYDIIARGHISTGAYGAPRAYLADSNFTWGDTSIQLYETGLYLNGINFEMYRTARVHSIFNGGYIRMESGQKYSSDRWSYLQLGGGDIQLGTFNGSTTNITLSGPTSVNGSLNANDISIYRTYTNYIQPQSGSYVYVQGHLWLSSSAYHIDTRGGSLYSGFINTNGYNINTNMGSLELNGGNIYNCAGFRQFQGATDLENLTYWTGSYTANVNWNSSNGAIRVNTSSRRFKENIRDASIDTSKVLQLRPRTFQRNDERDHDTEELIPLTEDSTWYVGFIAEEAQEIGGLDQWVILDDDGKPFSFAYDFWVVAHQAVLQEQAAKIEDLEARLERLERSLNAGLDN